MVRSANKQRVLLLWGFFSLSVALGAGAVVHGIRVHAGRLTIDLQRDFWLWQPKITGVILVTARLLLLKYNIFRSDETVAR